MKDFLKKYFGFIRNKKEADTFPSKNPLDETDSLNSNTTGEKTNENIIVPSPFIFESGVQEEEGYEAFARYLSLRMYGSTHMDSFPSEEFYVKQDLDDTITVLVLDYPSSIEHLLRSNAADWGKTESDLFDRALKNIQETYHRVVISYEGQPQAGMFTLSGDDHFKTSAVLYMEEYPALQGTHGALIALPDRDSLVCKTLEDDISLEVGMQFLVHFTDQTYHNSENRITRQIYWYLNGEFTVIPYSIGIERMTYTLPFELEDRLY
ncbi:MAG: hypothetical protein H7259_03200 [Cytophagales bacterium]|nr:hypothetical protein [Cytophaga sp.]